jgi:hypothetical protein
VHAVARSGVARAFELISNGNLEFDSFHIFEDEACSARNSHKVELLEFADHRFGLLVLQFQLLLSFCLRHH